MTLTAVTPLAGRARCVWRAWNCETHRMTLIALSFVFAISPTPYFTSSMTHLDCVDVLFRFCFVCPLVQLSSLVLLILVSTK